MIYLITASYHAVKPLPEGISTASAALPVRDAAFLADTSYTDAQGASAIEQQIFDALFAMIRDARRLIVLDMFLFNDFAGEGGEGHRRLSRELADSLIAQRSSHPELQIVLITDPINTFYDSLRPDHLLALEHAGIDIVMTDLDPLRDSNPAWSGLWRLCCRWLGDSNGSGWLPQPLGEGQASIRSYLRVLNFKANHRKVLIADAGDEWAALVTSANPHDGSSRHGNVALRFSGPAALAVLETERAVARMSGAAELPGLSSALSSAQALSSPDVEPTGQAGDVPEADATLRVLTERRILEAALALIGTSVPGDRLQLAMFYFSHRGLLRELLAAHERGVQIEVLLDPNRDAFGREKNGIPNRQVGMALHRAGIPVRWCHTRGEQCHSKLLLRQSGDQGDLLLGSANYTRRNLENYNLETNVHLHGPMTLPALRDAAAYFSMRWTNEADRSYSLPFDSYADDSRLRYWRYRLMEATGLSSF